METVEQLMIGEETEMQFVVDKALVQSLAYRGERYILSFILEYVGNALCLFSLSLSIYSLYPSCNNEENDSLTRSKFL